VELEMRFLAAGIVVARTDDDLIRYHDKFLIIDRRSLYMLSFNFTRLDIDHSRGFGIVTRNTKLYKRQRNFLIPIARDVRTRPTRCFRGKSGKTRER